MKILNLYAGIGGNRELWGSDHQVTAVELCPKIAQVYAARFPHDTVVVGDAHSFLLGAFSEFDFIWSSPPCQSHGQYRYNVGVRAKGYAPLYPDMSLYEEIILLKHHHNGLWAVENTVPYYEPLITPTSKIGRHFLWSNFSIHTIETERSELRTKNKIGDYSTAPLVEGTSIPNKRQVLRNCVDPNVGIHILACAIQRGTE